MHLLVLPSFYPEETKINKGSFFKDQVKALSKRISKVNVVYIEQRTLREFNPKTFFKHYFQYNVLKEETWNEYRIKGWKIPTRLGSFIWANLTVKLVDKYIELNGKPDAIHVHNVFFAGIAAYKIYEKYNIPYIITEHDSAFLKSINSKKKLKIASPIYDKAFLTLAVSDRLKKALRLTFNGLKVEVVPNIVNSLFFLKPDDRKNSENDSGIRFISIGNLNKNKGHMLLLDAFSTLAEKESVSLKVCGDGSEREGLQAKINELGLQKKVKLLGHLKSTEIYEQLVNSDCLVHTSYFETFGVVLVEALLTGLPFISTKSGGPEDIYEEGFGYLVEKGNVEELVEAMSKFIRNRNSFDKKNIKERARAIYSEESICSSIEKIYSEIIK